MNINNCAIVSINQDFKSIDPWDSQDVWNGLEFGSDQSIKPNYDTHNTPPQRNITSHKIVFNYN